MIVSLVELSFRNGVVTVVRRKVVGERMDVVMECKTVTATAVFRRK